MTAKKIFTYVGPHSTKNIANSLCAKLPIVLKLSTSIEAIFPLLSDPTYYTDFVVIDAEMFQERDDDLNMFEIMNTLEVLIKSTVHRPVLGSKPTKRETKIIILVNKNTDVKLIKEFIRFPYVVTISWALTDPDDYDTALDQLDRINNGDYTHHPKVLELLKPKKKILKNKKTIQLTSRQEQVLSLVRDRGASNKTIANMLNISESTVKLHMGAILKKYGLKNRTQLAVFTKDKIP